MATPLLCERCSEQVEAYSDVHHNIVVVDRATHGLGRYVLVVRLLMKVVANNEPVVDGETITETKAAGFMHYRAHDETCRKLPVSKRPPSQETTTKTPIRKRRAR